MSYVRSHTLTDILCPKCGRKGNLVLRVQRHKNNKIVKALYVRHWDERRVYYHYLIDVDMDDTKERELIQHMSDSLKCLILVAIVSNAKKLELNNNKTIIHYNTHTITLTSTGDVKVDYSTENISQTMRVAKAVVEEITRCIQK